MRDELDIITNNWSKFPKNVKLDYFSKRNTKKEEYSQIIKNAELEVKGKMNNFKNGDSLIGEEKKLTSYLSAVDITSDLKIIDDCLNNIKFKLGAVSNSFLKHNDIENKSLNKVKPQEVSPMKEPINLRPVYNELNKPTNILTNVTTNTIPQQTSTMSTPLKDFLSVNKKDYDSLISLKIKTNEILVIDKKFPDVINIIKLDSVRFIDGPFPLKTFPPENSKFVNLGSAILLTGGLEGGVTFDKCFTITPTIEQGKYSAMVNVASPMYEKRERHNIIYCEAQDYVVVCSGFYSNSAEFYSIKEGTWKILPSLKEVRANASMFQVNDRYVYCIGGFHVEKDKSNGNYLNSCEFLDLNDFANKGWTHVDLEKFGKMKLCAMGIINLSPNKILLVGGYDGEKYLKTLQEIEIDNDLKSIKNIKNLGEKPNLGRGLIFTSSPQFMKMGGNAVAFDMTSRLISYDVLTGIFLAKY